MLLKGLDLQWPVYKVVNELLEDGAKQVTVPIVHERIGKQRWAYTTIKTTLDRLADQGWLAYGPRIAPLQTRTYLSGGTPYEDVRRQMLAIFVERLYDNDEALLGDDLIAIKHNPRYKEVQDAARLLRRTMQESLKQATRAKNEALLKGQRKAWDKAEAAKLLPDPEVLRRQYREDRNLHVLIG